MVCHSNTVVSIKSTKLPLKSHQKESTTEHLISFLQILMASSLELYNGRIQEEEESFSYAMQLALSSVLPMSLQSAIELGLFDIMAKAGEGAKLSPTEIASQMMAKNPDSPLMLDRILRLLATHSLLNCFVEAGDDHGSFQRLYSLTPVSKFFVTNKDGVSLGPFMELAQDKVYLDSWSVFLSF